MQRAELTDNQGLVPEQLVLVYGQWYNATEHYYTGARKITLFSMQCLCNSLSPPPLLVNQLPSPLMAAVLEYTHY